MNGFFYFFVCLGGHGSPGSVGTVGKPGTAGYHAGPQDLVISGSPSSLRIQSTSGVANVDLGRRGILFVDARGGDGGRGGNGGPGGQGGRGGQGRNNPTAQTQL